MKDLEKQYSAEDIASAKAWVRNECAPMSEEGFEKAVKQVLELRSEPIVVKFDVEGAVPLNMYGGPTPKVELLDPEPAEEPLLTLDNVRRLPEMQKPALTFEDKVTNRLMLAMARGEIVLELDGTPEGKARDALVVKNYLTRNEAYYPYESRDQWYQATGGVTSDDRGMLWFEYPERDGMCVPDINPPRPTDAHATGLLEKLPKTVSSPREEMHRRHVDLTLESMKITPADERTGFEQLFRERHPDLHRGLPPGRTLKITPIKNDD